MENRKIPYEVPEMTLWYSLRKMSLPQAAMPGKIVQNLRKSQTKQGRRKPRKRAHAIFCASFLLNYATVSARKRWNPRFPDAFQTRFNIRTDRLYYSITL